MFSSLIQTILSVPESPHVRVTGSAAHRAGRGLYRRLGLAPDPEDLIPFTSINITLYYSFYEYKYNSLEGGFQEVFGTLL